VTVPASPWSTGLALPGGIRAVWSDATAGDLRPTGRCGEGALLRYTATATATATDMAAATDTATHKPTDTASDSASDSASTGAVDEVHWLEQVHGRGVVVVGTDGAESGDPSRAGVRGVSEGMGDALVSTAPSVALCVLVADCAPVALASPEGAFGVVHAGWRGLAAGVVDAAVSAMVGLGASAVVAAIGPCIHPCCYEFSPDDLAPLVDVYGPDVEGRARGGQPALDLPVAVTVAFDRAGAEVVDRAEVCTGCGGGFFSHRARGDAERQAVVVWHGAPSSGA
jgi:purine-nucleoside/S-methyl-5'-thioadenosine phosphorylase / adenosine deaminase